MHDIYMTREITILYFNTKWGNIFLKKIQLRKKDKHIFVGVKRLYNNKKQYLTILKITKNENHYLLSLLIQLQS